MRSVRFALVLMCSVAALSACATEEDLAGEDAVEASIAGEEELTTAPTKAGDGSAWFNAPVECNASQMAVAVAHCEANHPNDEVLSCSYNASTSTITYTYGQPQQCPYQLPQWLCDLF